jgi:hypothetical protein
LLVNTVRDARRAAFEIHAYLSPRLTTTENAAKSEATASG